MEAPSTESVETSIMILRGLEAMNEKQELTALGHHLAALPVDPRIGVLHGRAR